MAQNYKHSKSNYTWIGAHMHTCIHAYTHTCIHAYTHAYVVEVSLFFTVSTYPAHPKHFLLLLHLPVTHVSTWLVANSLVHFTHSTTCDYAPTPFQVGCSAAVNHCGLLMCTLMFLHIELAASINTTQ